MSTFYQRLTAGERSYILGPCLFETSAHMITMAWAICKTMGERNWLYKTSFQKANRTSFDSPKGDEDFLKQMLEATVNLPEGFEITTDVHESYQPYFIADELDNFIDVYQVPAFLCRQTELLKACAQTGKTVSVKKGQFMSPYDMEFVVEKLVNFGAKEIILIERGTTFGYNNLVVDMRSFNIMKAFGFPVIFDATHSVQMPGGGKISGGQREFILPLAKAALAAGADGIFAEVHDDPDNAPSDSKSMLPLGQLKELVIL